MTTTTTKPESEYSIIRCDRSGVFIGKIEFQESATGQVATLHDVRNIHYWEGAASVMQLAADGVTHPDNCRITVTVPSIVVTDVIQVIPCTKKAETCLLGIPDWKQ